MVATPFGESVATYQSLESFYQAHPNLLEGWSNMSGHLPRSDLVPYGTQVLNDELWIVLLAHTFGPYVSFDAGTLQGALVVVDRRRGDIHVLRADARWADVLTAVADYTHDG